MTYPRTTGSGATPAAARPRIPRAVMSVVGAAALLVPTIAATPSQASHRVDLRKGAVFSTSNDPTGNAVVAFSRDKDGQLTPAGEFATGGTGSGGFEDSANGLVLGSSKKEASPNNLSSANDLLFATNAGSDDISVFAVERDGLRLVERQDSGGMKPVSVTVNDGILYVLNSGETVDGLVPPNCSTQTGSVPPTISGFTVAKDGALEPIPGATYGLDPDTNSGCAQVSFAPDGDVLVVTERTATIEGQAPGDEGVINTFLVNDDGTLGTHRVIDATGQGPFGFTFTKKGDLLTTEQFDGPGGPSQGAATGYQVNDDGSLTSTGPSARNGGTDTCWIVATDDASFAFSTSFFSNNDPAAPFPESARDGSRITSYRIDKDGTVSVLDPIAFDAEQGASDITLSRGSDYLYQLNSFNGTINGFAVGKDGSLTLIQTVQAHAPSAMAASIGIAGI